MVVRLSGKVKRALSQVPKKIPAAGPAAAGLPLAAVPPPALGLGLRALRGGLRSALWLAQAADSITGGAAADGAVPVALGAAHGPALTSADAPLLFRLLDHLDRRMGGVRPHEVRLGALPLCAAADLPAGGQALLLGLPCLFAWTVDEFSAVVAHELAHLKLEDAAFTRQAVQSTRRLRAVRGPRQLLGWWSGRAAARVCRGLENRADRWAAACFRPAVLRSALEKLAVARPLFMTLLDEFDDIDDQANVFGAFGKAWDSLPPERIAALAAKYSAAEAPDPLDLHPQLAERLAALRQLEAADPAPAPASAPALALLADAGQFGRMLHNRLFRGPGGAQRSVFFPDADRY